MNNLKLYKKNYDNSKGLLSIVKSFRDDIEMQFSLYKCAKVTFKKDLLVNSKNITLDINICQCQHIVTYQSKNK